MPQAIPHPKLIPAREVAKLLGVCERTVWNLTGSGHLPPPVRIGRRSVRWRLVDLEAFIAGLEPHPHPHPSTKS